MHNVTEDIKLIARTAFPDYKGKMFQLKVATGPLNMRSYWDGGSRDYWMLLNTATGVAQEMPAQHPFFDKQILGSDKVELVENVVAVQHCIFCGKDLGLTVYIHPSNATKMIGTIIKAEGDEKIVLVYTRGLKSTYAGISNFRFHSANREKGITQERWEVAKTSCVTKGWMNKAGAITNAGRDAI